MITTLVKKKNDQYVNNVELFMSVSDALYYEFINNTITLADGIYLFGNGMKMISPYSCKAIYEDKKELENYVTIIFPAMEQHGYLIEIVISNGLLSAENRPALRQFHKDTNKDVVTYWFKNGLPHRENGMAITSSPELEDNYWLNGEKLTFAQFWERQKDTEHASIIMGNMLGKNDKS